METILGIIRHILTLAAGGLVGKGVLEASQAETFIGAVVAIIGVIWSVLAKSDKFPKIK